MRILRSEKGFTLLETIIAMTIMLVAFGSILAIQGNSLNAAERSKRMNVVGMLAKSAMVQTEIEIMGRKFDELQKEQSGSFDPPYEDYTYVREIKEVQFPTISMGAAKEGEESNPLQEQMAQMIAKYLKKALREVVITVKWMRGAKEQSYSVAMYWIDTEVALDAN